MNLIVQYFIDHKDIQSFSDMESWSLFSEILYDLIVKNYKHSQKLFKNIYQNIN